MQIPVNRLSRFYDIFVISLTTNAFVTLFVRTPTQENSSPVTTITWLTIYAITFFRIMENRRKLRTIAHDNLAVFVLVGLCCLSMLWTVDKGATAHATFSLVLTTFIAIDFSLRYTHEDFLRTVAYTCIVLLILSVPADLFIHVIPDDDYDTSTWHGVFGTKNGYGRLIVLTLTMFLCLPKRSKIITFLYVCATYALLARVHSTGALVDCTIMLGAFVVSSAIRWEQKARFLVLTTLPLVIGSALYFIITHFSAATTSVGKDPSLTGRTELWRMAGRSILDQPILGYGWNAFWTKNHILAWRIRQQANWPDAPHSHNGYIEMALGLGIVGCITLLTIYFKLGVRAYRYAVVRRTQVSKFPLMYLIFFVVYQFAETTLVGGNFIAWLLLVCISIEVSRQPALGNRLKRTSRTASILTGARHESPVELNA